MGIWCEYRSLKHKCSLRYLKVKGIQIFNLLLLSHFQDKKVCEFQERIMLSLKKYRYKFRIPLIDCDSEPEINYFSETLVGARCKQKINENILK